MMRHCEKPYNDTVIVSGNYQSRIRVWLVGWKRSVLAVVDRVFNSLDYGSILQGAEYLKAIRNLKII